MLSCLAACFSEGYAFAAVRCSDRDGGRPIFGSAAKPRLEQAVLHAAEEAVFSWRNMIALEHRAALVSTMPPEDRAAVEEYRGAAPPRLCPRGGSRPADLADFQGFAGLEKLVDTLARIAGRVDCST